MVKLFVYGTLRSKDYNHYLLKDEKFLGNCITFNRYKLEFKELPFLYDEPIEHIEGELYEISEEKLKILDKFEGHPRLYIRKTIKVLFDNDVIECYCYFYNK